MAEMLFQLALESLQNYYSLDEKMEILERKIKELRSREADVTTMLGEAIFQSGKKRKREVEDWLENVEKNKNEFESVGQEVRQSRLYSRLQLAKRIDKIIKEVVEILDRGRFPEGVFLDVYETRGEPLLTKKLVAQTFKQTSERIWACLMNVDVSSIGIYGMAGVGKTTLAMQIHNHIQENCEAFDHVSWVTVSQEFSIHKLQDDIAKTIHLDLSEVDDEKIRAAKLSQALMRRKKFVLILDDVWKHFDLMKVGIPHGVNGCKFILTTRELNICRRMGCQRHIEVEVLSEREAWDLFMETLGHNITLPPEVKDIAAYVARRCAGLPLGIITMAARMRGVTDIHEWRHVSETLREHGDIGTD